MATVYMTREQELEASRRLMQVAEWELQQILLDIHDGPVQHMYAALSQLDLLRRALEVPGSAQAQEVADRLQRIRRLLETGLNEIRTFISAFRTPAFESNDLQGLLGDLALQHESNTDTRVPLDFGDIAGDAPVPVKITLYRVLQEALSNAYRHGGAGEVTMQLASVVPASGARRLRMTVQDNGAGFDVGDLPPGKHFGVDGMRDRVEMIGGTFMITSSAGAGTRITVDVPLQ